MRTFIAGLFVVAVVAVVAHALPARADDAHSETITLPADGGTPVSTVYYQGQQQVMLDCTDEVRYKTCYRSACAASPAGATDSRILAGKQTDICMPQNKNDSFSLYRAFDGGTGKCEVYQVVPRTYCP
jgi:hypothetical protein